MEYEYRSSKDSVPPERVGEYLARLNTALQSLGYTVSWQ